MKKLGIVAVMVGVVTVAGCGSGSSGGSTPAATHKATHAMTHKAKVHVTSKSKPRSTSNDYVALYNTYVNKPSDKATTAAEKRALQLDLKMYCTYERTSDSAAMNYLTKTANRNADEIQAIKYTSQIDNCAAANG